MIRVSADRVLLKIDASRCTVRVGERVTADRIIGEDLETGEPIAAGVNGQVEAISFSGADHALLILVQEEGPEAEMGDTRAPVLHRVEASSCAVQTGDRVGPELVIGNDVETGEAVRAGVEGRVEAIGFRGADHSLAVLIRPDQG